MRLRERLEIRDVADGVYHAHAGEQYSSRRSPAYTARMRAWHGPCMGLRPSHST
jgi:hypothetical protein